MPCADLGERHTIRWPLALWLILALQNIYFIRYLICCRRSELSLNPLSPDLMSEFVTIGRKVLQGVISDVSRHRAGEAAEDLACQFSMRRYMTKSITPLRRQRSSQCQLRPVRACLCP